MIFYQVAPTWKLISLPFFTLVSLLAAVGLGLLFAPFEVRSRDTRHILGYIMRFWFYGTPVVYALEALPDSLRPLAQLNPMTSIIEAYRWAVLGTEAPSPYGLLYATVFAFVIFYVGLVVFKQQENSFADLI
jgi:lipopolysaccharide transport system permease protein